MKTKLRYPTILFAAALCNLSAALFFIARLPAKVAVHFNACMEADRLGSPWTYSVCFFLSLFIAAGLFFETKARGDKNRNQKTLTVLLTALVALFAYIGWLLVLWCGKVGETGLKAEAPLCLLVCAPIGILFVVFGNYLPVVKRNRMLGIKTPSTLASEYVWRQTHLVMGKVWVAAGLGEILLALADTLAGTEVFSLLWLAVSVAVTSATVPFVTHYFKKREPGKTDSDPSEIT